MSSEPVEIRAWTQEDSLEELTRLLHRAYAPLAAAGMRYLATHQSVEVTARRIAKECYVALLEGRLVGTITLKPPGRTGGCPYYERERVATFGQFGVDPDVQCRGVGGLLLETIERRARELGGTELALDTAECAHHLIARYERLGYHVVDRVDWDDTNYVSVIMAKSLGSAVPTD
jgi:GNAT superfamily N-acetyltransferase